MSTTAEAATEAVAVTPTRFERQHQRYARLALTGPGTLAGRYMRQFWQPVAVAHEVVAGRAKPIVVMNEELALWRSESGVHQLISNRCPHRGTLLHTGYVEDDCLRCRYHGWSFDGDGACVDAPAEHERFSAGRSVVAYPTQEYLGLVFAYMGEGEPPPLPRYDDLTAGASWRAQAYERRCNYFYDIDNGVDPTHTRFTHRGSVLDVPGLERVPDVEGEESEWGIVQYGRRGEHTRVSHHGMPNILHLRVPDYLDRGWRWGDILVWRVPVDDGNHINFTVNFFAGTPEQQEIFLQRMVAWEESVSPLRPRTEVVDDILAGRLTIEDVLDRPDLLMIQDDVTQEGQGDHEIRDVEQLGRGDVLISLLRRIWHRELDCLERGEPMTQWVRPAGMAATTGLD